MFCGDGLELVALQARRDGSTLDEPFAWQSREYLRQKCVGQVLNVKKYARCILMVLTITITGACRLQACTFKVDYVLENIPGREFGSVFLSGKNENLALLVVSSGWSKVYNHLRVFGIA